jgi:hypothetical protein
MSLGSYKKVFFFFFRITNEGEDLGVLNDYFHITRLTNYLIEIKKKNARAAARN